MKKYKEILGIDDNFLNTRFNNQKNDYCLNFVAPFIITLKIVGKEDEILLIFDKFYSGNLIWNNKTDENNKNCNIGHSDSTTDLIFITYLKSNSKNQEIQVGTASNSD